MDEPVSYTCYVNGEYVAAEEARVSAFDHGFLYGDGLFESMTVVSRRIFRFQDPTTGAVHECGPGTKFVIPERTLHIEEEHSGYKGVVGMTTDPLPQPFVRPPEELQP